MNRGTDPLPEGIELIDAGAGATPTEPKEPGPATRTPWWTWLAVAVAAAAVLALVADRLADDDEAPVHDAQPSELGIFDLDSVDIADATRRDDVTYPLFGRAWDHALVLLQRNTLIAVDLETGESHELADIGEVAGTTPSFVDSRWVDDALYLQTWGADLLRVGADDVGWAFQAGGDSPFFRGDLVGDWYVHTVEDGVTRATSLRNQHTVDLDRMSVVAGAGPSLLTTRAESIVAVAPDGTEIIWAAGQLLVGGHDRSAWRTCPAPNDCRSWSGDAAEPRAEALRDNALLDPASQPLGGFGSPPQPLFLSGNIDTSRLAPDGRILWAPRADDFSALHDLGGGGAVLVRGIDSRLAIHSANRAAVTTSGSIPTAIDLETGDMARIRLPGDNGALRQNVIAFVPVEDLPLDR